MRSLDVDGLDGVCRLLDVVDGVSGSSSRSHDDVAGSALSEAQQDRDQGSPPCEVLLRQRRESGTRFVRVDEVSQMIDGAALISSGVCARTSSDAITKSEQGNEDAQKHRKKSDTRKVSALLLVSICAVCEVFIVLWSPPHRDQASWFPLSGSFSLFSETNLKTNQEKSNEAIGGGVKQHSTRLLSTNSASDRPASAAIDPLSIDGERIADDQIKQSEGALSEDGRASSSLNVGLQGEGTGTHQFVGTRLSSLLDVCEPWRNESTIGTFPGRFGLNESRPSEVDLTALDHLVHEIGECHGGIVVVGHTCSIGSQLANTRLGRLRASRVKDVLVAHGAEAGRIDVMSCSDKVSITTNENEKGRRKNRRVTIHCYSWQNRAVSSS